MKKNPALQFLAKSLFGVLLISNIPTSLAASSSDPTDLHIQDLEIGAYSMTLTFTAGNQGGEAGYAGFRSEAELGKVVKNSFKLKQGNSTLYTSQQEWRDSNSLSGEYRYANSSTVIENTQFANYISSYLVHGQTYQIEVCLDSGSKVPESDETNNCTSATVTYSPNPTGDDDEDGLTNEEEGYLDLDPNNSDTDGDGLSDSTEISLTLTDPRVYDTDADGTNDYDDDTDADGLSNGYEVNDWAPVGTPGNFTGEGFNPLNFDTDEDGLNDHFEHTHSSYEANKYCPLDGTIDDGDHDGVKDGNENCDTDDWDNLTEYINGTSPILDDTDGDGFSDSYEGIQDSDPLNSTSVPYVEPVIDPNGDEDGDGLLNSQEELYGTDLYDIDSDNDFYTDYQEVSVSTPSDPLNATSTPSSQYDTDGDGQRNLFDRDDDGDGLPDTKESTIGTSPLSVDTDMDGINDPSDSHPLDPSQA